MLVWLNNELIEEHEAKISVFDRGFLYGDGLFESIRVERGHPFRWSDHMERMKTGLRLLGIKCPLTSEALRAAASQVIKVNGIVEGILRITLSRGVGKRGYSPRGADQPTLLISTHALPPTPKAYRLISSTVSIMTGDPLNQAKTANRLHQIMARAQADADDADDAIVFNTQGNPIETSSGNLFWIIDQSVHTPPVEAGVIPGVTRNLITDLCRALAISVKESTVTLASLLAADGVFVTVSSLGVIKVDSIDGQAIATSPLVERLQLAYLHLLRADDPLA